MSKLSIATDMLESIAEELADHPAFMPDATVEECLEEGGDSCTVTLMHKQIQECLAEIQEGAAE